MLRTRSLLLCLSLAALAPLSACSRCGTSADGKADGDADGATGAQGGKGGKGGKGQKNTGPTGFVTFSSGDWVGGRGACTENTAQEGCDSEWRHKSTQQLVRVFVVPIRDDAALKGFMARLEADVKATQGVADRFEQNGVQVLRYLQEARQAVDGGSMRVASISYVLVGSDNSAVHLITSVVPFDDQQPSDQRVRDLLTTASWTR